MIRSQQSGSGEGGYGRFPLTLRGDDGEDFDRPRSIEIPMRAVSHRADQRITNRSRWNSVQLDFNHLRGQ